MVAAAARLVRRGRVISCAMPYDDRGPQTGHLVETVRAAEGLIVASPEYYGGVSGLVKNARDLLKDLRDDVHLRGL